MTSYTASEAGQLVREARLRSGISQASLARRAGTSQAAISRIERGLERPTVERLAQILAGLGWRARLSLERLAEHEADPRRLREDELESSVRRLEHGLSLNRFARSLDQARSAHG